MEDYISRKDLIFLGGGVDRKNLRRLSIEDLHSQRRRAMIVVSGSTQWHMDDAARANTKR